MFSFHFGTASAVFVVATLLALPSSSYATVEQPLRKLADCTETTAPEDAFVEDIVKIIDVVGRNPGNGWSDSYSVGCECFMETTFDHDIGDVEVDTPLGPMTIKELFDLLPKGPGSEDRPLYNDIQCGNGPYNTAGDEDDCPGLVDYGFDGCGQIGPNWNLSYLYDML